MDYEFTILDRRHLMPNIFTSQYISIVKHPSWFLFQIKGKTIHNIVASIYRSPSSAKLPYIEKAVG